MKYKPPPRLYPTAYTPFLRRFTDERALDLDDLKRLYARVRSQLQSDIWGNPQTFESFGRIVIEAVDELVTVPGPFAEPLYLCLFRILETENTIFNFPDIDFSSPISLNEQVKLRRELRAREHFLANDDTCTRILSQALTNILAGITSCLPPLGQGYTAPLYALIDVNDVTDRVIGTLSNDQLVEHGLLQQLQDTVYRNICAISKLVPYTEHNRPFLTAADSTLPPDKLIEAYLKDTPFLDLLLTPLPLSIPRKSYREHGAIFAPSGHGKTQLLQHQIVQFLNEPDPPAMFIMDGMGAMLDKIARLEVFNTRLNDRLIILEPKDVPALNFFQMTGGSEAQQIELFTYLFTAIDQGLSTKMATGVRFIVQLMQAIPGATLQTMREVMEDPAKTVEGSKYYREISALDPLGQAYFRNQFFNPSAMKVTRESIASRLYTVLANPALNQMFSAPHNAFDALQAMQEKKIVLINTDRYFLGDDASAVFGRFFIAQCLAAALARAPVHPDQRHLALLIVDEAKDYFDAKTEKILSDARQFGLGLLFATQFVEQLPEGVRKAMYNNTAIKMAGPITYAEAVTFAREARTTPEFIRSMTNTDREYTEFAAYVRNVTPQAIKLTIPYGTLENEPRMSDAAYAALRERNRARFAPKAIPPSLPPRTAPPSVQSPPKPSIKWQTPE